MMEEESDMREAEDWSQVAFYDHKNARLRHLMYGGLGVVGVVILVVIVAVTATNNKSSPQTPTYATVAEEKKELFSLVEHALTNLNLTTDDLLLVGSYQYKAFTRLSENEHLEEYDDPHKLKRFALACFYHATYKQTTNYTPNPDPWMYDEYWLTDKHECDWAGVHCTASKRIHSISLERNNLTGRLPLELALISDALKGLDLSSNSLTMKGADLELFRYLPKLEKLLLDDNYLVTGSGLPASLSTCTELRKLRLSYLSQGRAVGQWRSQ